MTNPLVKTRPRGTWTQPGRTPQRGAPKRRGAARRSFVAAVLLLQGFCLGAAPAFAEDVSREEMRSLDEQVQEIKSDVLGIAAELASLEEKLLYPSNTQVSVFVSLVEGATMRLDSLRIQIDGAPAAHHIYSFKELEALQKGGVQRLYTGNVATGEHQLEVTIAGKLPGGDDFEASESFAFRKDVEPEVVGITLGGQESGAPGIRVGDW